MDARTILVVEDEPILRGIIKGHDQNEGHDVLEAADGDQTYWFESHL